MFTADCGYNNICLGYNVYYPDGDVEQDGAYCQFPESPGEYCTTSGRQPAQKRRIHAVICVTAHSCWQKQHGCVSDMLHFSASHQICKSTCIKGCGICSQHAQLLCKSLTSRHVVQMSVSMMHHALTMLAAAYQSHPLRLSWPQHQSR